MPPRTPVDQFPFHSVQTADEWAEKMPKISPPTSPKEVANKDILARVHKAVASHHHAITQEFENFDTMKSNTVSRDEFRSVCTRHVQILTDEQVGPWLPPLPKQLLEQRIPPLYSVF